MTQPLADLSPDQLEQPGITRRDVLLGATAAVALATTEAQALPTGAERGEPFDDGTWFDDGYGWVD